MRYQKILSPLAICLMSFSAIAPVKAQIEQTNPAASTQQIDVTLKTQNNQTFNQLIQQAEVQAVDLIEQEFATNPKVTEIAVNILGDRQGQQVPILSSRVSRSNWQQQPIISQWTKYFTTSAVLLGFNQPQKTPTTQQQSTPSNPPTPSASQAQSTPSNPPVPSAPQPSSPSGATPSNSTSSTPPSPNNAAPASGGASLEESDPGYR